MAEMDEKWHCGMTVLLYELPWALEVAARWRTVAAQWH